MKIPVQLPDGRKSSIDPSYNLRFVFPDLVRAGLERVSARGVAAWPWLSDYADRTGLGNRELDLAWACYGRYLEASLDPFSSGPEQAIALSGFDKCSPRSRDAVLIAVGRLLTATAWVTLRDCTPLGEKPSDVLELARRAVDLPGHPSEERDRA